MLKNKERLLANMTHKPMTAAEKERERIMAAKIEAKNRQREIARKNKNVIHAGNQPSQWGKVVQNEQRLIDNGHYMKSSARAVLDNTREQYRDAKLATKLGMSFEEFRHAKRMGTLPQTVTVTRVELRKRK